jgi:phosphatidylglycerol---prolipoprotein diacylglyceryl transferase
MNTPPSYYVLFVGISVLIALRFPVTRHIRERSLRRQYFILQGITVLGAIIGAKISVLFGDHHWPWKPVENWSAVLWSGRSIMGALMLGFLFAEAAKPVMGYAMPPNDRFAAVLPFTIAIGRIGCVTAGCCRGLPYDGWCALRGVDGISRYPTQVFEMIFQLAIGLLFIAFVRKKIFFGRLFSFYLMIYGAFRFLTEFIRDTPKFFGPLSAYQILSLGMIILGASFFLKRTFAPPSTWNQFESQTSNKQLPPHRIGGIA